MEIPVMSESQYPRSLSVQNRREANQNEVHESSREERTKDDERALGESVAPRAVEVVAGNRKHPRHRHEWQDEDVMPILDSPMDEVAGDIRWHHLKINRYFLTSRLRKS